MSTEKLESMAAWSRSVLTVFLPSLVAGILTTAPAMAAAVTNTMTGASNYPGPYVISPSAGNTQVDLWAAANGASFNVTSNLLLSPAASATAALVLDGSTNTVQGVGATPAIYSLRTDGSGIARIVLVNNAFLEVTNHVYLGFAAAGGGLFMTNSTLIVRKASDALYFSLGGNNNTLDMLNSTLNLNGTALTIGATGYGTATVQDSIITNCGLLNVSYNGGGSRVDLVNSQLRTIGAYSLNLNGGTAAATLGFLSLDHSTWIGGGGYGIIGNSITCLGTGVLSLANGSVVSFASGNIAVGLDRGKGQVVISNSTWTTASETLGGWIGVWPHLVGGRAELALHSGTNTSGAIYVGGATNTFGSYLADGASRVVAPALAVGYLGNSTGTFTMADATLVMVTNAGGTASITIGDVGKGTFTINGAGGAVTANTFTAGAYDSTVKFVLTTNGITPINVTGLMTMKSGAKLVIDVTQYRQSPALVLANYGSRTGSFDPANITIIGGDADVIQTATRISVKVLGLGTLILIR